MVRLDEKTTQQLQRLVQQFAKSGTAMIRQLITQPTPEAFPPSC
jgi:hypothetical protein